MRNPWICRVKFKLNGWIVRAYEAGSRLKPSADEFGVWGSHFVSLAVSDRYFRVSHQIRSNLIRNENPYIFDVLFALSLMKKTRSNKKSSSDSEHIVLAMTGGFQT